MDVYVVTKGDYSDYHIVGVYSSKELADLAHKNLNADDIETWKLDEHMGEKGGLLLYNVIMDRHGNTKGLSRQSNLEEPQHDWYPYYGADQYQMVFPVWAKDASHAVKIANERRIQLIASGTWGISWKEWLNANRT